MPYRHALRGRLRRLRGRSGSGQHGCRMGFRPGNRHRGAGRGIDRLRGTGRRQLHGACPGLHGQRRVVRRNASLARSQWRAARAPDLREPRQLKLPGGNHYQAARGFSADGCRPAECWCRTGGPAYGDRSTTSRPRARNDRTFDCGRWSWTATVYSQRCATPIARRCDVAGQDRRGARPHATAAQRRPVLDSPGPPSSPASACSAPTVRSPT